MCLCLDCAPKRPATRKHPRCRRTPVARGGRERATDIAHRLAASSAVGSVYRGQLSGACDGEKTWKHSLGTMCPFRPGPQGERPAWQGVGQSLKYEMELRCGRLSRWARTRFERSAGLQTVSWQGLRDISCRGMTEVAGHVARGDRRGSSRFAAVLRGKLPVRCGKCSARGLEMLGATGKRDGSNKSRLWGSGCLDLLNEQRHRALQVFPIDPTEDSAQECARPPADIYRKANRRLTGLVLGENVVIKNL